MNTKPSANHAPETRLLKAGTDYTEHGFVNPAVYHGSTVLFPSVAALEERSQPYLYGRNGSPTHRALEEAITTVEGGHSTLLCPSGLAAITTALLSVVAAGDHLLITDAVYRPVRHFCDIVLKRLGIETEYYDPLIGAGIGKLIRSNTRLVYTEQPGSQSMEVQDLPAIAATAHDRDVLVFLDNTWATGRFFNGFAHGADVIVSAGTKYYSGHSDLMLGAIICSEEAARIVGKGHYAIGTCSGPDDAYLALRGIRTLDVRLNQHMQNACEVARWLQRRPEIDRVLYPALPEDPGHEIWRRDFTGASGLLSVVLKPVAKAAVDAMLNGLELFGMGYSWGGYESLIVPFDLSECRNTRNWPDAPALRLHVGLEAPDDLIVDLEAGFARLNAS